MARSTNDSSTRQKAFAALDNMDSTVSRKDATASLMKDFGIGKAYAMTIYQQHRNNQKASGNLVPIYRVRDNGKSIAITTSHVAKASKNDATTPVDAVKQYVANLEAKIASANKLDTNIKPVETKSTSNPTANKTTTTSSEKSASATGEGSGPSATA